MWRRMKATACACASAAARQGIVTKLCGAPGVQLARIAGGKPPHVHEQRVVEQRVLGADDECRGAEARRSAWSGETPGARRSRSGPTNAST
jgi:hypothetical protein